MLKTLLQPLANSDPSHSCFFNLASHMNNMDTFIRSSKLIHLEISIL